MNPVPMARNARRLTALTAAVVFAAVLVAAGSSATKDAGLPTLYVAYTMNCTFSITNDAGNAITQIPPGTYQVQITTPVVFADVDLTDSVGTMTACQSFVQFQITGPGVNLATTLQSGDEDYGLIDATFLPGSTYTAVDNNQPSVARLVFTTASSGSPVIPTNPASGGGTGQGTSQSDLVGSKSSSTTTKTPVVSRGTLLATVSAAGKLSLTFGGKPVSTLKSGRYTISVTDRSKKNGFIVQESGNTPDTVSTGAFTGKRSVTVSLVKGQWFFYPSFLGTKDYFLVSS
jgi:hypothetical protein